MRPNIFLKGRSGIYGIRNVVNNKIYVGKTKCMYRRCHQYIYDFRERALGHLNDYLFHAMNKVGIECFEFFSLEFCEVSECSQKELEWICKLKSTDRNHGYNIRMDSSTGMVTSPETSAKISKNLKDQWAKGMRREHSDKLIKNWANNPERRMEQSLTLSRIKTKYTYEVHRADGSFEKCSYKDLQRLGLANVMSSFHINKSSVVVFKGFTIKRFPKGEE